MSAEPIQPGPQTFLSEGERAAILQEAEAWIALILARSDHGHAEIRVRINLKDRRVLSIRGGAEAARPRRDEKGLDT
jgi:hypothetical protein